MPLWKIRNMKTRFKPFLLIAVGALLAGCASMKNNLVSDTVGPAPMPSAQSNSGQGTLTVYSGYQVNAGFNNPNPNSPVHSNYKILDQDKKLLEWIHNATRDMSQSVVPVNLPAGKYYVVARSNNFGIVTVPVIIVAGRETVLHLDGRQTSPEGMPTNPADAVCLPDGEIVGWKSP
jgi:hypothetical protein